MKISQEVRDFARLQEATTPSAHPELVEGSAEKAEEGMAEMSKRFHEEGAELYIGANGREHD